jgi:outer membrane protein
MENWMRASRAVHSIAAALWFLASSPPASASPADPTLSLTDAVRQTLDANLDLAAERRSLGADREEIYLARSSLLPQIDLGASAQHLEYDRSDGNPGTSTEESLTLAAELSQVLYDENDWAELGIQKHVYDGQTAALDSFRLGVVQEAANAFLELDRWHALVEVRERNRELTAINRETSQARIAAGWSSQREVLRWESQLASNDTGVAEARAQVLVNRFQLNRVRNQPAEARVDAVPARIEEYGFVYAREQIVEAIAKPAGDRKLRDLLVRVGLPRSPELLEIDAAIAAEERLLTSNRRAFWVPSVSVGATVDYLAADDSGRRRNDSFDETEWTVGAQLTFPLLQGGAKFASLRQTRESLGALRIERRSTVQTVDQRIRAAFADASGAFASLGFSRQQEAAARRNYELVNDSYVLGVASILALLDGQSQLLTAEQTVTNAHYDFLEAVIAAQEQMALYPFLEPEAEAVQLLDSIERELRVSP